MCVYVVVPACVCVCVVFPVSPPPLICGGGWARVPVAPPGLGRGTCLLLELTFQACSMAQSPLVRGLGSSYFTSLGVLGVGALSGFPCPFGGFQLSPHSCVFAPCCELLALLAWVREEPPVSYVPHPWGSALGGFAALTGPVRLTTPTRVLHSLACGAELSPRGAVGVALLCMCWWECVCVLFVRSGLWLCALR